MLSNCQQVPHPHEAEIIVFNHCPFGWFSGRMYSWPRYCAAESKFRGRITLLNWIYILALWRCFFIILEQKYIER